MSKAPAAKQPPTTATKAPPGAIAINVGTTPTTSTTQHPYSSTIWMNASLNDSSGSPNGSTTASGGGLINRSPHEGKHARSSKQQGSTSALDGGHTGRSSKKGSSTAPARVSAAATTPPTPKSAFASPTPTVAAAAPAKYLSGTNQRSAPIIHRLMRLVSVNPKTIQQTMVAVVVTISCCFVVIMYKLGTEGSHHQHHTSTAALTQQLSGSDGGVLLGKKNNSNSSSSSSSASSALSNKYSDKYHVAKQLRQSQFAYHNSYIFGTPASSAKCDQPTAVTAMDAAFFGITDCGSYTPVVDVAGNAALMAQSAIGMLAAGGDALLAADQAAEEAVGGGSNPSDCKSKRTNSPVNTRFPRFKLPPSLLYGDMYLDHPDAPWNQPECFADEVVIGRETQDGIGGSYNMKDKRNDPNTWGSKGYPIRDFRAAVADSESPETAEEVDPFSFPPDFDFSSWYDSATTGDWLTTRTAPPEVGLRCAVPMSIYWEIYNQYGDGDMPRMFQTEEPALCLISLAMDLNCNPYRESIVSCASRQGYERLSAIVSPRCKRSSYWNEQLPKDIFSAQRAAKINAVAENAFAIPTPDPLSFIMPQVRGGTGAESALGSTAITPAASPEDVAAAYRHVVAASSDGNEDDTCAATSFIPNDMAPATRRAGLIRFHQNHFARMTPLSVAHSTATQVCPPNDKSPYVPPKDRRIPDFGPPRKCVNDTVKQHPISFGTSSRNFFQRLYPKIWDFHPVSLDGPRLMDRDDEEIYDAMGALSYFSYTHARGGWECYRHHQQLAVGCVPYYVDLLAKPKYIQTNFPIDMLTEVIKNPALGHLGYIGGPKPFNFSFHNYTEMYHGFRVKPRDTQKSPFPAAVNMQQREWATRLRKQRDREAKNNKVLNQRAADRKRQRGGGGVGASPSAASSSSPSRATHPASWYAIPQVVQSYHTNLMRDEEVEMFQKGLQDSITHEKVFPLHTLPFNTSYFSMGPSRWFNPRSQVSYRQPMGSIQHNNFDRQWYWAMAKKLKNYAYANMTAEAVVGYMLKTMRAEEAKTALVITHGGNDYLEQTIELGLDGLGIDATIVGDYSISGRECCSLGGPDVEKGLSVHEVTTRALHRARHLRTGQYAVHGLYYSNIFRKLRHRSRYLKNRDFVVREIMEHGFEFEKSRLRKMKEEVKRQREAKMGVAGEAGGAVAKTARGGEDDGQRPPAAGVDTEQKKQSGDANTNENAREVFSASGGEKAGKAARADPSSRSKVATRRKILEAVLPPAEKLGNAGSVDLPLTTTPTTTTVTTTTTTPQPTAPTTTTLPPLTPEDLAYLQSRDKAKPLFDVIIYAYFAGGQPDYPEGELDLMLRASNGKVALVHHYDSWYEPSAGVHAAKKAFYFDRELRRDDCPPI